MYKNVSFTRYVFYPILTKDIYIFLMTKSQSLHCIDWESGLQLLRNKNKFLPFCCVINIKTCQSVGGLLSFVLIATSPSGQSSNSTVD